MAGANWGALLPLLLLAGCAHATPPATTPIASIAATAHSVPPSPPAHAVGIRWIENDYESALAAAKSSGKPIFVDSWATWCHSCLAMREFVFTDPLVRNAEDAAVWLAVDVDRPENERFVKAHPAPALPTFFLLDASGAESSRWVGTLDPEPLVSFVKAGIGPDRVLKQMTTLELEGNHKECLEVGIKKHRELASKSEAERRADFVTTINVDAIALSCAAELSEPERTTLVVDGVKWSVLAAELPQLLHQTTTWSDETRAKEMSHADDISSAYETQLDVLKMQHAPKGDSVATGREWAAFLEKAAHLTKSPSQRAAFDAHRMLAYVAAETPEKAIPMLEESAKDFPSDYNPSARLAKVQLELKQLDAAEASAGRALSLAYGPRKIRFFSLAAAIAKEKKDSAKEKNILTQGIAYAKGFGLSKGYQKEVDAMAARLAALSAAPR